MNFTGLVPHVVEALCGQGIGDRRDRAQVTGVWCAGALPRGCAAVLQRTHRLRLARFPVHPLAKRLRDDHRHLLRVLAVLEAQLEALGRAEDVDFDLMLDAMTYITEFPNRLHHPVEDVLFEQLADRDASAATVCREQIAEHERLFHDSAAFYGLLEAIQMDEATLTREQLVTDGRAFIEAQRAHLAREEAKLLPMAEQALDTADWDRAALTAGEVDDPLDATSRPARYEALYRALSRLPA
ncbi:hemerythrin domain-containing protein [Immundisolibacter sp.]|uniref:hemerythrin domain-containing protein n=1 Tax=Immundisolibacter sp. TaxID=1934948 RepID=UPI000EC9C851|nr:hypothetical protein [Gammaproteobacteria bacterium]